MPATKRKLTESLHKFFTKFSVRPSVDSEYNQGIEPGTRQSDLSEEANRYIAAHPKLSGKNYSGDATNSVTELARENDFLISAAAHVNMLFDLSEEVSSCFPTDNISTTSNVVTVSDSDAIPFTAHSAVSQETWRSSIVAGGCAYDAALGHTESSVFPAVPPHLNSSGITSVAGLILRHTPSSGKERVASEHDYFNTTAVSHAPPHGHSSLHHHDLEEPRPHSIRHRLNTLIRGDRSTKKNVSTAVVEQVSATSAVIRELCAADRPFSVWLEARENMYWKPSRLEMFRPDTVRVAHWNKIVRTT
ncbi:hypothetical protein RvY_13623 [Ramazzottius varieornatus]|uniref:Uncharacterized protein n=1 Tax=Ramazzottius varieornatus TaxID=947166 RepID=A0A1D1VVY9_RAMVA|nr:hypothetical protein RvY_13623 [Ramazzottius varieornatus]